MKMRDRYEDEIQSRRREKKEETNVDVMRCEMGSGFGALVSTFCEKWWLWLISILGFQFKVLDWGDFQLGFSGLMTVMVWC